MRPVVPVGRTCHVTSVAVVWCAIFGCGYIRAEEPTPESVLRDMRSGYARLQKTEEELTLWDCEHVASSNGQAMPPVQYTVKQHGGSVLGVLKSRGLICRTPEAFFALEQRKATDRWTLLKYQPTRAAEAWDEQIKREQLIYHPLLSHREEFTTPVMIADPLFVPTAARSISRDRVELDFRYQLPNSSGGARTEITGTLTLATNMDWLVVKWVSHAAMTPLGHPVDSTLVREVQSQGGIPRINSARLEYVNGQTKALMNATYPDSGSVNPDEFKLEHYQIPVPAGEVSEDRPPFNWPLWGGIGVGCIALSILLAWLVRRKRRA
jgi:hypothetical protein